MILVKKYLVDFDQKYILLCEVSNELLVFVVYMTLS